MYTTRSALIKQREQSPNGRKLLFVVRKIGSGLSYMFAFVRSHKNMMTIMIPIAATAVGLLLYFVLRTAVLYYQFGQDENRLLHSSAYDTTLVADFASSYAQIPDAIVGLQEMTTTVDRYVDYLDGLQTPYQNFLQHLLLPSLFIWQDPYTKQIDTSIVGRKFIEQNPFTDTALIQYWSDFFRNVGDGTDFILIKDMKLGAIQEGPALFTIPITVSFTAPSKRAFLLLVDKLSLTSQESTISLINQFFYHLWLAIQDDVSDIPDGQDTDNYIGQYLYNWAFANGPSNRIDSGVITQAIQEAAQCQLINPDICLYTFRNIYRSIPQLAYGVGLRVDHDAVKSLKRFIQELPPVITIANFNFQRTPAKVGQQSQYEGSVVIHMHGRSVQENDVNQVAYLLGTQCLGNNIFLSPDVAGDAVDSYLRRIADTQIAQQQSTQLLQLRRIITENQTSFDDLSNYHKIIRLFEIHRMLADAGICR